jgi:UDPglucose 6-dehydrogenase
MTENVKKFKQVARESDRRFEPQNAGPISETKIKSITREKFSGQVYNLELVSQSHTEDDLFWVEENSCVVTHNCFPKDVNAMISLAKSLDVQPLVLHAVNKKNDEVRPFEERDWLSMTGRAVSED